MTEAAPPPARSAPRNAPRPPLLSVALISAGALGYEVLLTRLFSIVQWHHFAYMVISIALLGFGASGTFLALAPGLVRRFRAAYVVNLALFGAAAPACFLLAQRLSVHPEQLLWEPLQMLRVSAVYLLLAAPFFFAANGIALALTRFPAGAARVYAADLLGAAAGSAAVIGLLYLLMPAQALHAIGAGGLAAALLAAAELRLPRSVGAGLVLVALALAGAFAALPPGWTALAMSEFKPLSQQLQVKGARVETERSSPLGLLSVVASPEVPLRHAPGLALTARARVPEQRGIFVDGGALTAINAYEGPQDAAWLDQLTSALPYHLAPRERVLVLGAGGGALVRQALAQGANAVTAVELDPALVRLVAEDYGELAGHLYRDPRVTVRVAEARGFVQRRSGPFDLIQVAMHGGFAASAAGLHALSENYLYTVEALGEYYERLAPGGLLALGRWVKLPPRDSLKLFATAVAALGEAGIDDPGERLLLVRSWQTSTLLVKKGRFTGAEKARARAFADDRGFDLAWYAGMPAALANRNNRLPRPYLYEGAQALLGEGAGRYLDEYKFDLSPATDDRPYFSHFFKWRTLPEILALRGRGGVPLLESGYLLVVATLAQALLLSLALVVLPLARRLRAGGARGPRLAAYFTLLGLGFLFVEIALIQELVRFLHHPVLAVAAALTGFLAFAGLGSALAGRLGVRFGPGRVQAGAVAAICALAPVYAFLLPPLVLEPLAAAPVAARLAVAALLIAPLALPMGMPFPLGLARLRERDPALIPAAWAFNGCASVISAVLASLLAMELGFDALLAIAAALYLLAVPAFRF